MWNSYSLSGEGDAAGLLSVRSFSIKLFQCIFSSTVWRSYKVSPYIDIVLLVLHFLFFMDYRVRQCCLGTELRSAQG